MEVRIEAPYLVDDIFVRYQDEHREWIQTKESLQRGTKEWVGLWKSFESQFWRSDFQRTSDRLTLCVGIRTETFHTLDELCRRADGHNTYCEWHDSLNKQQQAITEDVSTLLEPAHTAETDLLAFFRAVGLKIWPLDEVQRDLVPNWIPRSNKPQISLFSILRDSAGDRATIRKPFYTAELMQELATVHQIEFEFSTPLDHLLMAVTHTGDILRQHRQTIGATEIHVERAEVATIAEWAKTADFDKNVGVILDQAGMGKTVVACDVLKSLEAAGVIVLAIKADQQLTHVSSQEDLMNRLRFPDTVDKVVARIARVHQVVILIDQVDALSLSMARDQTTLDLTLDTVARLRRIPNVRILLSCRSFDLHNDHKLSQMTIWQEFALTPFSETDVERVLQAIGCDYKRLSPTTQALLQIPLHLDIFVRALEGREVVGAYHEIESIQSLYGLLWRNVVMRAVPGAPPETERKAALMLLSEKMHSRQQTMVSADVFATTDAQPLLSAALYLASNGVLNRDANGWTYFHQTFFDYCFAMQFVESGSDLHQMICAGDQGLDLRPQMVQILSYLRGTNSSEYCRQLRLLFAESGLREHLRDLLFRWFGALATPTEDEWTEARRMLTAPLTRRRLLRVMRGNPGWFARLRLTHLPRLLEQHEAVLDDEVIPYIASLVETSQAEVMNLIRPYIARSEAWDRRIAWVLGMARKGYGPEAVDLFAVLFPKYLMYQNSLLHDLEHVVQSSPETGACLIRAYLDFHLDHFDIPEPDCDDPYNTTAWRAKHNLLQHLGVYALEKPLEWLAKEHPRLFIEHVLPFLERLLSLFGGPGVERLWYYPDWLSHGWYNDIHGFDGKFPWLFIEAFKALAQDDIATLRSVAARLETLPYQTSHQLIAHAYRAAPQTIAQEALSYLLADDRRLLLGDVDEFETRQLIRAIYPYLLRDEQTRLESHILSFAPVWQRIGGPMGALYWRGVEQLNLLRAIPRDCLTREGERRLCEWERKWFPVHVTAEDARTMHGGFEGSPIENVEKLSNRDWLLAMKAYHGARKHKDFLKGGAYQLSGNLKRQVMQEPDRFYRLAMKSVPLGVDENYVRAFLDGLTESGARLEWICELIRRFAPVASDETKRAIARNLRKRYSDGIPCDLLDLLESYIREPLGQYEADWMASSASAPDEKNIHNDGPDHVCINTVRGSALDVLILALVQLGTDEARERQWALLEFVVSDPSTPLRSGGIHALIYKIDEARERALDMFEKLMAGHPLLLRSRHTQEFLYYGLARFGSRMFPFLLSLLDENSEEDQQRGAELVCLLAMHNNQQAEERISGLMTGRNTWRRGCAHVYANNVTTAHSQVCYAMLTTLLNDKDQTVRAHIGHFLTQIGDEEISSKREFLDSFLASQSLHDGFHELTEFLKDRALLDPTWTLEAVDKILNNPYEPNERTRFRDNESLICMVVQVYTHAHDPAVRKSAMDTFDRLIERYAGIGTGILADFDRH